MPLLALLCLRLLHICYSLLLRISLRWKYLTWRPPQSLTATRQRLPNHLAIILATDSDLDLETTELALLESVERAVGWCHVVGIEKLTVYDSQGIFLNGSQKIRECVTNFHDPPSDESSGSDLEYPLTPPLSDYSKSRPLSPEGGWDNELNVVTVYLAGQPERRNINKRRNVRKRRRPKRTENTTSQRPLALHIVSQDSSKQAIATTARSLARMQMRKLPNTLQTSGRTEKFKLSIDELGSLLEGKYGLSSPDLIILHPISPSKYNRTPPELHGFPPWQIRLSEIHHNKYCGRHWAWFHPFRSLSRPTSLDEVEFREALDEFARAEMRLGK